MLQRIAHTEGAVTRQDDGSFLHEYVLRDHLGNTRVTFSDVDNDGTVVVSDVQQINSYYPFGLNMESNFNGAGGKNKYAYNGKEWNDDFGLGMNDYGARFYDPAVARWSVIDPMAERYTNLSPYNYVSNNPIIYIDPDGMQIIDAEGIVQTQKNLLDKNKGAVDEALKMAGLSEDMSKKLKDYKSSLNDQLDEIKTLEKSDQVYNVSYEGDATAGGATSYNEKTKAIDIQIGKGKSEIDESGVISHELKHGHQYENGQLSLKVKNDGYGSLYDISDEVGAYNNQSVLEYGSFYQSNSWDEKKVRSFGKGMIPSAYQDLPSGPTNINSKEGKALRERTKQAGANGSAVEEVYKGWEKDYQKGKK